MFLFIYSTKKVYTDKKFVEIIFILYFTVIIHLKIKRNKDMIDIPFINILKINLSLEKKQIKIYTPINEKLPNIKVIKNVKEDIDKVRKSWLLLHWWIGIPVLIKIIALEKAWNKICINSTLIFSILTLINISLNWEVVEKATIFFKSYQHILKILEKKVVRALNNINNVKLVNQLTLKHKKILATTIVEEWSNEDTGVGLSIAIGSQ